MKTRLKTNKGITLIALVITIIVLLILAGVSIATLTGQNGILTQATESSKKSEIAEAKEQGKLDVMAWQSEKLEKGEDATLTDALVKGILTGKDYVGTLGETSFTTKKNGYEIPYKDLYNPSEGTTEGDITIVEGVPVPKGFYHVGGTKTEGFVISDNQADENKDINGTLVGNQFVWIPVDNSSDEVFNKTFKRTEGYYNGSLQTYLPDSGEADSTGINAKVTENSEIQEEAKAMYASVKNNGGFYIARYEAGNEAGKVVSKKGATVWNSIKWGNSMTDITGGAVEKARGLADQNGYTSVKSTLCYSVQWDAAMNFIDSNYITNEVNGQPNCDTTSYVRKSTGKGNYDETENTNEWKGKVTTTGASLDYQVKNIYDLAGNVTEWTMESRNTDVRVLRRRLLLLCRLWLSKQQSLQHLSC